MAQGGFAVEAPVTKPPPSRWWYVAGGVLMAPWGLNLLLHELAEVAPIIPFDRVPWWAYVLALLGFFVGGVIMAITASKRFKRPH